MTTKEIKSEIQKSLDRVPDTVLESILDFLRTAEKQPSDTVALANRLQKILNEDKALLERLAK